MTGQTGSDGTRDTVSLIIVNYNAGALLQACVSSSLDRVDELIVVDNASSDDSLARLEAAFPGDARLQIVRNPNNRGFAAACNAGVRRSSGSHLFFLNPDCVLQPDTVTLLLRVLADHPAAGMVGGSLVDPDGTEQGGGRRAIPTPWRSFVRAFGLQRFADRWPRLFFDFHLHKQPLPTEPSEVEAISGACMLVRRVAMEDAGQWDEGYFLHCEDLDLCMTMRRRGWKILFVPEARIIHDKGGCSRSRPIFVEWHKHRGMVRFYRKFFGNDYPAVLMWLVILGVWLRFALLAGYHAARRFRRQPGAGRAR